MIRDPRNPDAQPGEALHGYSILRREKVSHLRALYYELEHEATGARHAHLSLDQDENVFLVSFRTVPGDSTGVAHILEHTILEGSQSFPVKMFARLTGRSLNSFINAMTASDRTSYPFATTSEEDYHNLLTRYLDAVYHPLLRSESFLQEGWRLEFEDPGDESTPLVFRGVVYNEMKAALSRPERRFHRAILRALFPDLCYAHESGGDPREIPRLSEEDWRGFHRRHYYPGNSWTYTFGCFPLAPILERIDGVIAPFGRREARRLGRQDRTEACRRELASYPAGTESPGREAGEDGPSGERETRDTQPPCMAAVCWRLNHQTDLLASLELGFLFEILAGGLSAPLNRALLDGGLAPALAPVGFESQNVMTSFSVGLKGLKPESLDDLERLVLRTLDRLAREGVDPALVQAGLDRFELEIREQSRIGGMPYGLGLGYFALPHWMAGGDLLRSLRNDALLAELRERAERPGFLSGLIRRWLLENDQRVTVLLSPDRGGLERMDEELTGELRRLRGDLNPEKCREIVDRAGSLERYRRRAEDLDCMPVLHPERQPREARRLPSERTRLAGRTALLHDQPTNGLCHLRMAFPLDPAHPDLPLVDLLGWLPRLGAGDLSVEETERRIKSATSGIGVGSFHCLPCGNSQGLHMLNVDTACLWRRSEDCLEILTELLYHPRLDDERRLTELLRMRQTNLRSQVVGSALHLAVNDAVSRVSPIGACLRKVEGISFVQRVQRLRSEGGELGQALGRLLREALDAPGAIFGLTGETENLRRFRELIEGRWPAPLEEAERAVGTTSGAQAVREAGSLRAWIADVDGAFVAEAFPAPSCGHPQAPLLYLLGMLMIRPLYERIRAAGGAYGSRAAYDWSSRSFSMLSWRDPRIAGTLEDFAAVRAWCAEAAFGEEDLRGAKIEALRRLDAPLLPQELGAQSFSNYLIGRDQEMRDRFRAALLDAGPEDLARCAVEFFDSGPAASRSVVCAERQLDNGALEGLDCLRERVLEG